MKAGFESLRCTIHRLSGLHFPDDGQDQRAPPHRFAEVAFEESAHLLLQQIGIAQFLGPAFAEHVGEHPTDVAEDVVGGVDMDETARDDLRVPYQTSVAVHGNDHDDEAILRQVLAVPHHDLGHFLRLGIDEDLAVRHTLFEHLHRFSVELHYLAVGDHHAVGNAHIVRQPGVMNQVPQRPMHGDEEPGTRHVEHQLQLFLTGMARHMDIGILIRDHLSTATVEVVDEVTDRPLVPWDDAGGDDDQIAAFDSHLFVLADGHAHQRG